MSDSQALVGAGIGCRTLLHCTVQSDSFLNQRALQLCSAGGQLSRRTSKIDLA